MHSIQITENSTQSPESFINGVLDFFSHLSDSSLSSPTSLLRNLMSGTRYNEYSKISKKDKENVINIISDKLNFYFPGVVQRDSVPKIISQNHKKHSISSSILFTKQKYSQNVVGLDPVLVTTRKVWKLEKKKRKMQTNEENASLQAILSSSNSTIRNIFTNNFLRENLKKEEPLSSKVIARSLGVSNSAISERNKRIRNKEILIEMSCKAGESIRFDVEFGNIRDCCKSKCIEAILSSSTVGNSSIISSSLKNYILAKNSEEENIVIMSFRISFNQLMGKHACRRFISTVFSISEKRAERLWKNQVLHHVTMEEMKSDIQNNNKNNKSAKKTPVNVINSIGKFLDTVCYPSPTSNNLYPPPGTRSYSSLSKKIKNFVLGIQEDELDDNDDAEITENEQPENEEEEENEEELRTSIFEETQRRERALPIDVSVMPIVLDNREREIVNKMSVTTIKTTVKKLLGERINCKLVWIAKNSAQCSQCFKFEVEIANLENQIQASSIEQEKTEMRRKLVEIQGRQTLHRC